MKRRNFIKNSFGLLVAAPMVVRAESIMRISPEPNPDVSRFIGRRTSVLEDIRKTAKNIAIKSPCLHIEEA